MREVAVDGLAVDRGPVTVAQFARVCRGDRHVTLAERPPDPAQYPEADPDLLVPGSAVFHPTPRPVPLNDPRQWCAPPVTACATALRRANPRRSTRPPVTSDSPAFGARRSSA